MGIIAMLDWNNIKEVELFFPERKKEDRGRRIYKKKCIKKEYINSIFSCELLYIYI